LTFRKQSVESELGVKVNYIVSEKITDVSKQFTDVEFIKECMESAAEMLCPSQNHLFTKVSLSAVTVARRIEELLEDIENTLKGRAYKFVFYSVALDDSTDITDAAQLAIVIRGIDDDVKITEEMAALFPVKGTTKGSDLLNALKSTLRRFNQNEVEQFLWCCDRRDTSNVLRLYKGLVALICKGSCCVCGTTVFYIRETCAKHVSFKDVMREIVNIVNFIR
jgi:hypothetical protein